MNNEKGSATAIGAAAFRLAHQLFDGEHKLLNDPVILQLIDREATEHIQERRNEYFLPGMLGMRTHIVLRSRFTGDCLQQAYVNGVKQYLILGAGLDTFAYRQPEWAVGLKIIEADHPASQAGKRQLLHNAGIAIPENIAFAEVDLEADDLHKAFEGVLNFDQPVFIACLGVLIYLTKPAIGKIFRFAGSMVKRSEFIFTASQKRNDAYSAITAERVAQAGEPWISFFDPEETIAHLTQCGFSEAGYLSTGETYKRYFKDSGVSLPPPQRESIVRAVI